MIFIYKTFFNYLKILKTLKFKFPNLNRSLLDIIQPKQFNINFKYLIDLRYING